MWQVQSHLVQGTIQWEIWSSFSSRLLQSDKNICNTTTEGPLRKEL